MPLPYCVQKARNVKLARCPRLARGAIASPSLRCRSKASKLAEPACWPEVRSLAHQLELDSEHLGQDAQVLTKVTIAEGAVMSGASQAPGVVEGLD